MPPAPRRRPTPASTPASRITPPRRGVQTAIVAILRAGDALRRRFTTVLEPHGITLQQYNVLRILRGAHPESLATYEVAERMMEQAPGVTRLLDRLEELGWASRTRSTEDRRLVHCRISKTGLALLAGLDTQVREADERALGDLTERELATLAALLQRVEDAA